MRVVMVSPNFHPYLGGAERQALELSKALLALGTEVTVLTRRVGTLAAAEEAEGVRVVRLPVVGGGLVDSACFMLGVFAWLLVHRGDYDAVHVHLAGSPALAAAAAGRLLGKPVVVKLGGGRGIGELAASSKTPAGSAKLAALARLKPLFAAVTPDLLDELAAYRLGAAPAVVVPNGVDTARYRPAAPGEKAALRAELGWPKGTAFLYVGRIAWEKRLPAFVKAFAEARFALASDAFLVLAGLGPETEAVREAASRAGLGEAVKLLGARPDADRLYRAADVFVLPSVSEGLSNALLEAMSSGLAVLASRVGGTKDAVQDGQSGLLFDPGDAAGLKAALERFLKEPGLAEQLGRRARETAVSRFDLKKVAQRYLELYRGGTSRPGS